MPPDYLICTSIRPTDVSENPVTVERLVRAKNEARAIAFVVKDTLTCDKATTDEIIRLTAAGVKLETAE